MLQTIMKTLSNSPRFPLNWKGFWLWQLLTNYTLISLNFSSSKLLKHTLNHPESIKKINFEKNKILDSKLVFQDIILVLELAKIFGFASKHSPKLLKNPSLLLWIHWEVYICQSLYFWASFTWNVDVVILIGSLVNLVY